VRFGKREEKSVRLIRASGGNRAYVLGKPRLFPLPCPDNENPDLVRYRGIRRHAARGGRIRFEYFHVS
jgi:hypothetical protein